MKELYTIYVEGVADVRFIIILKQCLENKKAEKS